MKKNGRRSKSESLIEEVDLIEANTEYANVGLNKRNSPVTTLFSSIWKVFRVIDEEDQIVVE